MTSAIRLTPGPVEPTASDLPTDVEAAVDAGPRRKILLLTKRHYTGRDLLGDRYGRLWEIPQAWARRGHKVEVLALSYRPEAEADGIWPGQGCSQGCGQGPEQDGDVRWHAHSTERLVGPGLVRYFKAARAAALRMRPDVVVGASDVPYVIAARHIARGTGATFVADLYDNFEAFAAWRIPTLPTLFRRAVRDADGVVCVSDPLLHKVVADYGRTKPTAVVENGIDANLFQPLDKHWCRARLGLPPQAKLIGTAGALFRNRGIDALYDAHAALRDRGEDVFLVVAGPRDHPVPSGPGVIDLGNLPNEEVPYVINALDLAVICNIPSPFGDYCFPQKASEILACGVPLLAAGVGAMAGLLRDFPQHLFRPGDAADLARKAAALLAAPAIPDVPARTWSGLADRYARFFETLSIREPL